MSIYLLKIFSWTGEVAKVHESKFHETLLSVSGYFRMKFVSPVCAPKEPHPLVPPGSDLN